MFKIEERPLPEPKEGELLVKAEYISVDPGLRPRMTGVYTYAEPFKVGQTISSSILAKVIKSKSPKFKEGEYVGYMGEWAEYAIKNADHVRKQIEGVDPEAAMSVVGLNGLTAYFGLMRVGKLKEKNAVIITGAAGATGYVAGCIAKSMGCKVVGIVGSERKVQFLKELGFDSALNYKTTKNMKEELQRIMPGGFDLFFDNVGGETADAIRQCMKDYGHVVQCGAISAYNLSAKETPQGPRQEMIVVGKRLRWKGFIVMDYRDQFDEALQQLAKWYTGGKIPKRVTIKQGFEQIPKAFAALFEGENMGKMLVKV